MHRDDDGCCGIFLLLGMIFGFYWYIGGDPSLDWYWYPVKVLGSILIMFGILIVMWLFSTVVSWFEGW